MTHKRAYRLVVVTRLGGARMVYRSAEGRFSYRRGKTGRAKMTALEIEAGKKWARRRLVRSTRTVGPDQWPFLVLGDTAWPTNKRLLRALNATGKGRRRLIRIVSGLRTPREAWVLRMRYLNGQGNLAARCCSRYSGKHSWESCGKDPWSNHADGNAADCGTLTGIKGTYTSLANDKKARRLFEKLGGCFPVVSPWEPWHAEMR